MNGTQQYTMPPQASNAGNAQFDPQGFLGSLLGGVAGGMVGKQIGGSTGQTIGNWAGRIGGGFLPFESGPLTAPPTDFEMQGFWSVLRKIGQGVGTGVDIGKQLGIFQAGQPAVAAAPPTDFEMQGFWSVLRKIGQGVGTGLDIGKQLGIFQAGQPAADNPSSEQMIMLLQQALPAIQALAQQQQMAGRLQ